MRNKKLITLLVLLLALILFIGACGGKDKKDDGDPNNNNTGDNGSGSNSGNNNGGNSGSGNNNGGNSGSGNNNGGNGGSGNNNGGNGGSSTLSLDEMVTSDRQLLDSKGYATTFVENSMVLSATENVLKAEKGSLSAVLNCDKGMDAVYIYYFKTANDAKACYDANWASDDKYSSKDNRIVYDSTSGNVFEGSGNGNNGSSGSNTNGDLTEDDLDAILSADYNLLYDLHEYYVHYEKGEYNTYLNFYAPDAGFVREEIYGILTANSTSNASSITVYYFWSEALAQKYYDQKWSRDETYTLSGLRVICDTDGAGYLK